MRDDTSSENSGRAEDAEGAATAGAATSTAAAAPADSTATAAPAPKPRRIWPHVVLLAVLLAIAGAGAAFLISYDAQEKAAISTMESQERPRTPEESAAASGADAELVENPIDFASLMAQNSDIFAWLYMPGCDISTPLFQSPTDDLFYLSRNMQKEEDYIGSPFIQLCNSDDLDDPVAVVYGHRNKGIFEALLQYQDKDFFDANLEFYVYVPGHIYTYTVVSSYIYDTRHIMNSFDFGKQDVVDEYFSFVMSPDSISCNVNPDATLQSDSRLLQLSTCSTTHEESDGRYIVSAVRTADQPTY